MRFSANKYILKWFRRIGCSWLCLLLSQFIYADHIKGGWIGYSYQGTGSYPNSSMYQVTVYLYASCTEDGPTAQVVLGAFDASSNAPVLIQTITQTNRRSLSKSYFSPCLNAAPDVCYRVFTYTASIELPDNSDGYILTSQQAFRVDGILNIANSHTAGITFTATIPGIINNNDYHINSSPVFSFRDTAIICKSSYFTLPFSATDLIDGDSLSYSFGNGLNIINASDNSWSTTPKPPPYPVLDYISGYSGAAPLGNKITVNPVSGLISGITPADTGEYVIAVYVKEWRRGVLIDSVKKELQVIITDCSLTSATLEQSYINCNDYAVTFQNLSAGSTENYNWDFGVRSINSDVSTMANPTYVYPDTGTYTVKLNIRDQSGCSDSAKAVVKIYPGFSPGFTYTGSCYQSPFTFTDTTAARYGTVSSLSWDFGDLSTTSDVSAQRSPNYTYAAPGTATVTLNVSSSKGCTSTLSKTIIMSSKPDIHLAFSDTLICSADSLRLSVSTSSAAIYQWTPNYNIINTGSANPIVYPKDTTTYKVVLKDRACIDSAVIKVNVLDGIDVKLPADTTICKTDTIQLNPVSDGLKYTWSPSTGIADANIKYARAAPLQNTLYNVIAALGTCKATAATFIKTINYPATDAGTGHTICFGESIQLHGYTNGSSFTWQPVSTLQNSNTLDPVAVPDSSTAYVLAATDTLGCPKPARDTVQVIVIQTIQIHTINDTAAVVDQPVILKTTATADNLSYTWSPGLWLSSTNDQSPVFTAKNVTADVVTYVVKATDINGCSTSDSITIRLFNTGPEIFVPTAFSPNGDSHNDIFKPITAGVTLQYYMVYDRWGKALFYSTRAEEGWDGTYNGKAVGPGTYVWMVKGTTYTGRPFLKRGTVVLLR